LQGLKGPLPGRGRARCIILGRNVFSLLFTPVFIIFLYFLRRARRRRLSEIIKLSYPSKLLHESKESCLGRGLCLRSFGGREPHGLGYIRLFHALSFRKASFCI